MFNKMINWLNDNKGADLYYSCWDTHSAEAVEAVRELREMGYEVEVVFKGIIVKNH